MSLSPQDTPPRELPRPAPGGFFTDRSPPQGETQMVDPTQMFQNFWRCAHHPSALENFEARRTTCEWDCHTQKLEWWHGGVHPMPKSWGNFQSTQTCEWDAMVRLQRLRVAQQIPFSRSPWSPPAP